MIAFQEESGLQPPGESATRLAVPTGNWTATNGVDTKLLQRMWERKTERTAKVVGLKEFCDNKRCDSVTESDLQKSGNSRANTCKYDWVRPDCAFISANQAFGQQNGDSE